MFQYSSTNAARRYCSVVVSRRQGAGARSFLGGAYFVTLAMKQAAAEGKGAVSLDGRLIDYASIRQAEVLVEKAAQIAAG